MKNQLLVLIIILVSQISLVGQSRIFGDKMYVSNPELALKDATTYVQAGNISHAILCYKKYAALTGKDMSAEISKLERSQYPSWYNASTMQAIPMNDGGLMIVHKELRSTPAWHMSKSITVPGIYGVWDIKVGQEEFRAIQQAGFYIPGDGLYSRSVWRERYTGTEEMSDVSYSLSIYTMTNTGERKLDCGQYSTQRNRSKVVVSTSDTRYYPAIFFYPLRKLHYINGSWQIDEPSE